jgi:hypothetical protein
MKGGECFATTEQKVKVQEMDLSSTIRSLDLTNVAAITPL